ncbi:MAG: RNA polymerase sigma-I factor [Bacillota bacterium]
MRTDANSATELLAKAKSGDLEARNALIRAYMPFVLSTVSKVLGRYVTASDEEASVGVEAFDEAISAYEERKSGKFLAFAGLIIRRRLIDYLRRQPRHEDLGLSETCPGDDTQAFEAVERREEIEQFKTELSRFGISLEDLVKESPKHKDARERAKQIARYLAADNEAWACLMDRGQVPLSRLEQTSGLHRKTIERHRKYIIAIALIYRGEYFYLRDYLDS